MSILLTSEDGWIISHLDFINQMYSNVDYYGTKCSLKFDETVFKINSPFIRANQIHKTANSVSKINSNKKPRKRKRKYSPSLNNEQFEFLEQALQRIISTAIDQRLFTNSTVVDYNDKARRASKQFYKDTTHDLPECFNGGNHSSSAMIIKLGSNEYIIPENCTFYSYDIQDIDKKLELSGQFDFILMDPPWWNKFIRRNKSFSYKMMHSEELCKIPINNLLNYHGIIAIWCTNAASHINSIIDSMFPTWGIKLIAKWHWIKVTQSGNVVCNFNNGSGKQPSEMLIFGAFSMNQISKIPDKKILVSVPSAIHSHKPPIAEVIKPYLKPNPNCLEIFARYTLPGWTSWGLEVLKFQRLFLYNVYEVNEKNE